MHRTTFFKPGLTHIRHTAGIGELEAFFELFRLVLQEESRGVVEKFAVNWDNNPAIASCKH